MSNELVKTHDRLVIENLNVAGMLANHRLARAISDAGWAEFARLLGYKHAWRAGDLVVADRWYPVKPARLKREPTLTPHQRPEPTTPEKGGAQHPTELFDTL